MKFALIILFGLIASASADGMGIGYGSFYMQNDVTDKPQPPAKPALDVFVNLLDEVLKSIPIKLQSGSAIMQRMKKLVLNYEYKLTATDMDILHSCYYFKSSRHWYKNDTLTEQEEFCMRLIDFKPTFAEATEYEVSHRFLAMSEALKVFSPKKPFYPTEHEKLMMEECYFARTSEKKNISLLSPSSEPFCHRLQRDILNGTQILMDGPFYPFGPFHNYWNNLTLVARKDYDQVLKCYPKLFNQRFSKSGPCNGYYTMIHKSSTIRDFRRKHLDACLRMQLRKNSADLKMKCSQIIAQYKQVYCGY